MRQRLHHCSGITAVGAIRDVLENQRVHVDAAFPKHHGMTSLMALAASGHLQVVKYLVEEHGAAIAAHTDDGVTALMKAAHEGHLHVIKYLVEDHGAAFVG